ncbi:hypothetical protein V6615_06675 [Oscillospiraceae bacterium PP1C4]
MITCPKCGHALAGNPRCCGYCGESLVSDYFRRTEPEEPVIEQLHHIGAGATAAMTLGIFGSIALLGALAFHMTALFGYGITPEMDYMWWIITLLMAVLPVVYLVQIAVLRGIRFSLLFDCVWLFLAGCGLSIVTQAYLDRGSLPFCGLVAIPYLLVVGCSLVLVASITAILSYQK